MIKAKNAVHPICRKNQCKSKSKLVKNALRQNFSNKKFKPNIIEPNISVSTAPSAFDNSKVKCKRPLIKATQKKDLNKNRNKNMNSINGPKTKDSLFNFRINGKVLLRNQKSKNVYNSYFGPYPIVEVDKEYLYLQKRKKVVHVLKSDCIPFIEQEYFL